jgi:hypothetical protein
LMILRAGGHGTETPARKMFLFFKMSRPTLGSTKSLNQLVRGVLSSGVNLLGSEDEHLSLSSAEVKNVWSYSSSPPLHGVDGDKFAFTFPTSFLLVSEWWRFSSCIKNDTHSANVKRFLSIAVVEIAYVLKSARLDERNVQFFRLNTRS